jgi:hypothetical protein
MKIGCSGLANRSVWIFQKTPNCKLLPLICLKSTPVHIQLSLKVRISCFLTGAVCQTMRKNILAAMTHNSNGFEFSIFDFIWEEINAISESPLKSCGYEPYIMHMIERVTARTFG